MPDKDEARAERVKRAQSSMICETCNKIISRPNNRWQRWHSGECQHIGINKKRRDEGRERRAAIPIVERVCECGTAFQVKQSSKRKYCFSDKCKNARARRVAAAAKAAGKGKKLNYKKLAADIKPLVTRPKTKILAKCPRCERDHMHTVEVGFLSSVKPRYFCDKCRKAIEDAGDIATRYSTSFPTMREYHAI